MCWDPPNAPPYSIKLWCCCCLPASFRTSLSVVNRLIRPAGLSPAWTSAFSTHAGATRSQRSTFPTDYWRDSAPTTPNRRTLLFASELLKRVLRLQRLWLAPQDPPVRDPQRPASPCVTRTGSLAMLPHPPLQIICNPTVQTPVPAPQHVHPPRCIGFFSAHQIFRYSDR